MFSILLVSESALPVQATLLNLVSFSPSAFLFLYVDWTLMLESFPLGCTMGFVNLVSAAIK